MRKIEKKILKNKEGYTLELKWTERGEVLRKKYLHSPYDPFGEANEWVNKIFDSKVLVYLIYGAGLLYHVRSLQTKIREEQIQAKIIIVEPFQEITDLIFQEELLPKALGSEEVLLIPTFEDAFIRDFLGTSLNERQMDRLKICIYPTYQDVDLMSEKKLMESVRNLKVRRILLSNTMDWMKDYVPKNLVKNAKYLINSPKIQSLENLFPKRTAVIVSSGPSLEKNVDLLKEHQDRVLIISGGRSLRALLSRGIRPHFVCSLDGHEDNYRLYREMEILSCDIPMISAWGNNYKIVENYAGKKIFYNNSGVDGLDEQFLEEKILNIGVGFTVASLQMRVAMQMGCDTIIFIGQDLAYAEDRRYGKDTQTESDTDSQNLKTYYVKGNVQDKVKTGYDLDTFRLYLEEQISYAKQCVFINATEGGAYIGGTSVMTLQAALEKYSGEAENLTGIIDECFVHFSVSNKKELLRERFGRCLSDAKKLQQYGREGLVWAMKITLDFEKNKKVLKKLETIDKKIESVKESTNFSNYFIQKELAYIRDTTEEDLDNQEIIDQTRLLYRSIRSAGAKMAELLEEELKVLEEF